MDVRPVPGWPLYLAREDGVVVRIADGRPLSVRFDAKGYPVVDLRRDGRDFPKVYVHQIIAAAFHGERPAGLHTRHLDGDKWNSRPDNLAYGTCAENAADRRRYGKPAPTPRACAIPGNGQPKNGMCGACGGLGHNRRSCGREAPPPKPARTPKPSRLPRYTCGFCKSLGHNRRTCTAQSAAAE